MNQFGGDWTDKKIEILVEYAKAYLVIMNKRSYWKLMYFDGFAGTGFIVKENTVDFNITIGAARRIIEIDSPKPFDEYYFVEKNSNKVKQLIQNTKKAYPQKKIYIQEEDCNKKMCDLAVFLKSKKGKYHKILAYIDPCGMQVEWKSIENLKGLPVDMWVLVPTGLGVNRLLKKNGQISDAWIKRLELFLGLSREEIESFFYMKVQNLFNQDMFIKSSDAINKSGQLYKKRLEEVFEFVSKPFELKNSANTIMYHLYLASNNKAAITIANDIVNKYNR